MIRLLEKIGYDSITKVINKNDATEASALIRKALLNMYYKMILKMII